MIDPAAGTMRRRLLDHSHVEFPRVDDRLIGPRRSRRAPTARTDAGGFQDTAVCRSSYT
ncbi:hypothetical protein [Streptomyces sp. NPDC097610]|uniref:hypothetical protein n=1 Tax=Streptomyces sp. NPDC097610 TaxID=3157227 RepID=UPI00331AA80D